MSDTEGQITYRREHAKILAIDNLSRAKEAAEFWLQQTVLYYDESVKSAGLVEDLRDCLRAFVTFHGGHVLPPELQAVMARARAVLERVEGSEE